MQTFVRWYNHEHRHSRVRFLTPEVGRRHVSRKLEPELSSFLAAAPKQLVYAAKVPPFRRRQVHTDSRGIGRSSRRTPEGGVPTPR